MAAETGRFLSDLEGKTAVADTNVLIYHVEAVRAYVELTGALLVALAAARARLVVSTISVAELLAGPYREKSREKVETARSFAQSLPSTELAAVTVEIADRAAWVRSLGLRMPDAIVMATALVHRADVLVTNDPAFRRKIRGGPRVLLLDDYV